MTSIEVLDVGAGEVPVLFLHGLGSDAAGWQAQLDEFSRLHRCIAWTMPGYGSSASLAETSFPALADAASSLLEDLGPAVVVGHSMGGMIAMELTLRHPELVAGLVLVATSAVFGKPGSDFNKNFLATRLAPLDNGLTPCDIAPDVVAGLLGSEPDPEASALAIKSMCRISAAAYRVALDCLVTWDRRETLADIGCSCLCLAGGEDITAPVEAMKSLTRRIRTARLEVIPGVGHLVNLERPWEFNQILSRFIDETATGLAGSKGG